MIKEKLFRYASIWGTFAFSLYFCLVKKYPVVEACTYALVFIGYLSFAKCGFMLFIDIINSFRKPKKFSKVLPDLEGVKKNEG